MCGFAGFIDTTLSHSAESLQQTVGNMVDTLITRGPDDRGLWVDPAIGYAVGFRRLAIVDLSPEGHQPMISPTGRYVIAFNGEIYNHGTLRQELHGLGVSAFRGHSDTEVMLAAIETWGVLPALKRFAGMFAFALWDRTERRLFLCRDRMGEKPLYYGWHGQRFFFASELKALCEHPEFSPQIDKDILPTYLRQSYIPAPWSIYRGISKLHPGHTVTITSQTPGAIPEQKCYWSLPDIVRSYHGSRVQSVEDWTNELETKLKTIIAEQMLADVPLGAFLSGGVDSSTIVALMQAQSSQKVRTFTIGFHESDFNEAEFASAVAQHLQTEHTELYVSPQEALDVIPNLPHLYDEPFADSSQIPTYLVAKMARQHVTVSLSGDGGDEVFAGYHWYGRGLQLWQKLKKCPAPLRSSLAWTIQGLSPLTAPFSGISKERISSERCHKLADLFRNSHSLEQLHRWLNQTHWNRRAPLKWPTKEAESFLNDKETWPEQIAGLTRLQYFDMKNFLPDDILVKVDRASMGVSLESRAPFLDHRIVEFAFSIPPELQQYQGKGKWLLRQVLYRHVPESLIERPKKGFSVPLAKWLRGPLRDWAESLLDQKLLEDGAFFHASAIRDYWNEHVSGKNDWSRQLWNVLMFQAWHSNQKSDRL